MGETGIGLVAVASLVGLAITCLLWMLGGRKGKWKRRFAGSAVLAGTVNGAAVALGVWDVRLLLLWLTLAVGFSLGYGGDSVGGKVVRRLVFAVGVVTSGLVCIWILGPGLWPLYALHLFTGVGTVLFALRNPVHAPAEEVLVCLLLNAVLLFYPFVA